MFEAKNIKKTFHLHGEENVYALKGVSLNFGEKGMVFILGKSGSGKTTLLNVLGGLERPDSGEVIVDGVSSAGFKPRDWDSYRNRYVGFVFQEYNLLPEFSIRDNIALALELQKKKATKQAVAEILAKVDLHKVERRKPKELSGGQKQRVAIARALVKDPKVILADEPTGALDGMTGEVILQLLKKISVERLVIVVSHDREFAETYGDRVIEIADGLVISDRARGEVE